MRRRDLLTLLLTSAAATAVAQPAADTLRVTWRDSLATLDPYRTPLRTGLVMAHHIFDCLVDRDPDTFQLKPLLATAWRQAGDTAIDFTLRPGVFFHDGTPFGVDDVVATVRAVLADTMLAVPSNYAWLAGAETLDGQRVRIGLRRVFPAALEYLAMALPILPAGVAQTRTDAFGRAPVGTGPYRLAAMIGRDRIELERFEGYFAASPKGRPAIRRVVITEVDDPQAEVADLLAGRADWIWSFDPGRAEAIAAAPGLQLARSESMRVGYLSIDAAGRGELDAPLGDPRVREAIVRAVDRAALAKLFGPGARVLDAPCYPTQFGCDASAVTRYDHDPTRAKALLAEAGFGFGFATEIVSYVLPRAGEAVRDALQAVGIAARLTQLPTTDAVARAEAGTAPLFMGSWGSTSINDVSAFLPVFFGGGANDYAREPALRALIEEAGATTDPDRRRALYGEAIGIVTRQALWLPLQTYVSTYGLSRALEFRGQADEIPRFYLARWQA